MRRGAFSCGRGDCPAGACPPPCRLTAPLWCPQGGVSGWLAADRAVPEAARGACFFSRLPILPLAFFTAPLPRRGRIDPRPRSQSALPLRGRGRDYSFLMQGAAPLASPGLNPGGTYSPNKKGTRRGGACLVCLLPALTLVCFVAPIPPTPFPSGEGGDFRLFYARGFAPCIPGAGRGAALAEPAVQETEGGGRRGFGRLLTLPLACFPAPIPPTPFPSGEGGAQKFISPGATAPGTPGIKPPAALTEPAKQVPCEREPAVLC